MGIGLPPALPGARLAAGPAGGGGEAEATVHRTSNGCVINVVWYEAQEKQSIRASICDLLCRDIAGVLHLLKSVRLQP